MEWVPIVFVIFKVGAFGTCMFFAIKWHYDKDKQKKNEAKRSQAPVERAPDASE